MPRSDSDIARVLVEASPFPWALVGEDGLIAAASRSFEETTGCSPGSAVAERFPAGLAEGEVVQLAAGPFEVWARPVPEVGRLVVLRDRSEIAKMEDQLWEQQARLSKVYSELSVRNQALTSAMRELREREGELSALNRDLEKKVEEQIRQLESSHKLRRYLSPEVANSILSGEGHELGTRKRILTIVFADLGSFDDLTSDMESEEVIEILNDYHKEMVGILFANGGTLDKFLSARIVAFFGDPVPQEDHAARAVRTGLQMRARVAALARRWFPGAEAAEMQVGVHTGYATVGNVGSEHRMDYTVIGKNVSFASALQQAAEPGQVLLSARTQEAVKDLFDVESMSITLKGSSRPILVFGARGERVSSVAATAPVPSGLAAEASSTLPGQRRFGPYSMIEKLGEGGMGVVYKALDERLQRIVALKVLASELAADAKFVARFKKEAMALASLNSPYVAQIYFVSDQEVPPFFAMEFIEGSSLRKALGEQGRLPLRRALDLAIQIARGLQAAAERGVIHRDVKPDNVMLTARGRVKITDFGLAKGVGEDTGLTSQGMVLGTPLYMSPEQARGEELDFRSDIYSFGGTFFHMLAGRPPFQGKTAMAVLRQHEEAELPPLASLPSSLSGNVYLLLKRMMAKKREDRFESYEDLIAALEGC